jgi:hypothetical protein
MAILSLYLYLYNYLRRLACSDSPGNAPNHVRRKVGRPLEGIRETIPPRGRLLADP